MWEERIERKRETEKEREREGERGRERQKEREAESKRERDPKTHVLLRERLLRSQSVACAEVRAGAFKALAGQAPTKTGRTRPQKKRACELVHHNRCSKWPHLARTSAKHL